jgi:hypothetical protein
MRPAKKVHRPGDTRVCLYMCLVAHALWLVIFLSLPLLVVYKVPQQRRQTAANGGMAT